MRRRFQPSGRAGRKGGDDLWVAPAKAQKAQVYQPYGFVSSFSLSPATADPTSHLAPLKDENSYAVVTKPVYSLVTMLELAPIGQIEDSVL
jgi:hypothetical protein